VFGESLTVLAERASGAAVPRVVAETVRYLLENALAEEGLFRYVFSDIWLFV
jgi:hypothetical protein